MEFMDLSKPEYSYMFGFLQADGHLSWNTRLRGRLSVELAQRDEAILRDFKRLTPYPSTITRRVRDTNFKQDFAFETVGCRRRVKRNARDGVFNIMFANEPAVELAQLLYEPDCLALERKRSASEKVSAWERPSGMRRRTERKPWTAEDDAILMSHPLAEAAAIMSRNENSCSMRRWRLAKNRTGPGGG